MATDAASAYQVQESRALQKYPSLLVADDDPNFVHLLKENLESHRYFVSCAYDGQQALEQLSVQQFDLILLDIDMPNVDGLQVLARLRAKEETAFIPVIIISGQSSSMVYPQVAHDPRASFLKKPLDLESLSSLIRYYLKR